jgi:hypothetical protein
MTCDYKIFHYISMVNIAAVDFCLHKAYLGHYDKQIRKART